MRDPQTSRRRRSRLLDGLMLAAQQLVADGLAFHVAVSERLDLSLTDLRYLQRITEGGPATPSEIAVRTGLTTGAVTRVLDRLEQAGYIMRTRDTTDRRSVVVTANADAIAKIGSMYQGVAAGWRDLLADYSDEHLEVFLDLFQRMQELSRREAARLH